MVVPLTGPARCGAFHSGSLLNSTTLNSTTLNSTTMTVISSTFIHDEIQWSLAGATLEAVAIGGSSMPVRRANLTD